MADYNKRHPRIPHSAVTPPPAFRPGTHDELLSDDPGLSERYETIMNGLVAIFRHHAQSSTSGTLEDASSEHDAEERRLFDQLRDLYAEKNFLPVKSFPLMRSMP